MSMSRIKQSECMALTPPNGQNGAPAQECVRWVHVTQATAHNCCSGDRGLTTSILHGSHGNIRSRVLCTRGLWEGEGRRPWGHRCQRPSWKAGLRSNVTDRHKASLPPQEPRLRVLRADAQRWACWVVEVPRSVSEEHPHGPRAQQRQGSSRQRRHPDGMCFPLTSRCLVMSRVVSWACGPSVSSSETCLSRSSAHFLIRRLFLYHEVA